MFKRKTDSGPDSFDTLIGTNTTFEGNIECQGVIRVDGKVKGDIKANGNVFLGNDAVVTGNIYANDVHVAGTVEGNVYSKGLLRMLSTARLYGDIQVHSFVADEGGIFQGKCSMTESASVDKSSEKITPKKSEVGKDYKKSTVLE